MANPTPDDLPEPPPQAKPRPSTPPGRVILLTGPRRGFAALKARLSPALLVVGAILGLASLLSHSNMEADRLFTSLAICLAGPERVAPEEAPTRVRRFREDSGNPDTCADQAREVAESPFVKLWAPGLSREAAAHQENPGADPAALFRAGEILDWSKLAPGYDARYAPGARPQNLFTPVLDEQLPLLRERLPGYHVLRGEIDRQPLDRAVLSLPRRSLAIRASGDTPLAVASWEGEIPRQPHALERDGQILLLSPAGKETPLGPGTQPALVGEHVVFLRDGALRAVQLRDGAPGKEVSFDLPTGNERLRHRSCLSPRGQVLAVEQGTTIRLFLLAPGGVETWGSVEREQAEPPAHVGPWSLNCTGTEGRVAWARSEPPPGPAPLAMAKVELPVGPQRHRLIRARCGAAGCATHEGTIEELGTSWQSSGGWSSSMFLATPDVIDLGEKTLLLWGTGRSLRFRLAPPEELPATPSRWLAEVSKLQENEPRLERAVNWPRLQIHARDGVALVLVEEHNTGSGASFLVRFDMRGSAFVIDVPTPG